MELTYNEYLARNSYQKFTNNELHALLINYSYTCDSVSLKKVIGDGVNISLQDENGNTALFFAVQIGCLEAVKELLSSGININLRNNNGDTALSLALIKYYSNEGKEEHGDIASEIIKICGGYGMYDGEFLDLIHASQDGNIELVNKLIDAGMFLDFQTDNGYTALMEAIIKKHDNIAIKLIDTGANTDLPTRYNKFTPLGWAASQGNMKLVQKFISANANLNILDDMQHTPLMEAIGRGYPEVAKVLIDAGANPNT